MNPIDATVSGWLHRPYIDLGPAPQTPPNHTAALEMDCASLFDDLATPWFWSSLNPSFRTVLVADVGLPGLARRSPAELAGQWMSPRWRTLTELVRGFADLDLPTRVKVARMLNRLCFFRLTRDLLPDSVADAAGTSAAAAQLAWCRAIAGYKLWLEDEEPGYSLAEFDRLATTAGSHVMRISAHYQLVVQHVKHHNDVDTAEHWQRRHHTLIEELRPELDEQDYLMAMSRSYRVAGFIPQMRADAAGMVRDMELAQEYALRMDRSTDLNRRYAVEMLYPVQESRIKEALWLRDLDLALARATEHRDAHRLDARVWVHLGNVQVKREEYAEALLTFQEAVRLSPPGGEVGRFMVGQLLEEADRPQEALDAYLGALRVDPLGTASANRALEVAETLGSGVSAWARKVVEAHKDLRARAETARPEGDGAYRDLPAAVAPPVAS
jgi:tetratricopeptide (TPR) repeat protein